MDKNHAGLASQIVDRLVSMHPTGAVLHEPVLGETEKKLVADCIETGWVSSIGKYVDEFERRLAEQAGVRRAVVVCNGTVALQMCLQLAGVRPGDEVLVPTLTFIATANAVTHAGGVPHFVDSEERTLGIDAARLAEYLGRIGEIRKNGLHNRETGRRIAALVPMHVFGNPCELESLLEVCRRFGLELVEDGAESLGSTYGGRAAGSFGKLAALSFNGNKIVTTGGGGAILTDDESLGARAKHLTTTAKIPHRWRFDHDEAGYNFRMPNLNAALGCAQLERLSEFVARKRRLAERYFGVFEGLGGVKLLRESGPGRSNYWLNTLVLDRADPGMQEQILAQAHERKILLRPVWSLNHRQPMYASCPRMELSTAESLESRIINLPSSAYL